MRSERRIRFHLSLLIFQFSVFNLYRFRADRFVVIEIKVVKIAERAV